MKNATKIVYLPYVSKRDDTSMQTQTESGQIMDKIGYFFGGAVFACILFILAHYLGR